MTESEYKAQRDVIGSIMLSSITHTRDMVRIASIWSFITQKSGETNVNKCYYEINICVSHALEKVTLIQ